jgi:hypothetical protein
MKEFFADAWGRIEYDMYLWEKYWPLYLTIIAVYLLWILVPHEWYKKLKRLFFKKNIKKI